jgi:hypothetical protein
VDGKGTGGRGARRERSRKTSVSMVPRGRRLGESKASESVVLILRARLPRTTRLPKQMTTSGRRGRPVARWPAMRRA